MNKPKLQAGSLAEELHLAFPEIVWDELTSVLHAQAPNEGCAFVLVRPSRGVRRTTLLGSEIIWPTAGEVETSPGGIEISADYISRVLDIAIDSGPQTGALLVHTHPKHDLGEGPGLFSPRDDWYEARLFPTLTNDRPTAISGSLVIGSQNDVSARAWWNSGVGPLTQPVQIVRVIGPEVRFIETSQSVWKDHLDPNIMDRSTRFWGLAGRRILQNLRVGIVGAGGTGSIVILSCAQMGVGKISIWDKDVVRGENRHRNLGVTRADLGKPKAKVMAAKARECATAAPFQAEPFVEWATISSEITRLQDCDLIFCCVDKLAPRVPLNRLAYQHLIPVIDMSSWIHPDDQGVVDAIMTHAHVWSPTIPCAWCRGTLSSRELTREAQGKQRDAERRIAYGLPLESTDGVEPSVLPLNLAGVGLALTEFMQVAMRIADRTPRDLKLLLPQWELDESDLEGDSDCECRTHVALGESIKIQPVD